MTRPPRIEGATPSPNIWHHPATYEIENRAADPHGRIEEAMSSVASRSGARFLDVGCGSGFHLPQWASTAASVIGVEPHPDLARLALRRTRKLSNVAVSVGTAQALPIADASVDVMQARWAYFFGPGSEPGLAELDRVMARGGTAFVIDNDGSRSTFGSWFLRGYPMVDPVAVERFWSTRGWTRIPVDMGWSFSSRADFEAVVRIEFAPELAESIIATHEGTDVDYAVNVWWRRF
ncbi:class I SAM-dependent methyltransferase [Nocardioides sp. B-3]|uniref:class I SAM-dependent methyltransferase n=1 Tax=Nocardioides sp. B-3 TaxID=2895565 RepID=UPI0021539658|nr:class I SAM-dependent methyltransferase [Nocardioides sp. B-3]UUZ60790.1 class I SAM-dependent methyltransferase [Nocardioides sp. B-3]